MYQKVLRAAFSIVTMCQKYCARNILITSLQFYMHRALDTILYLIIDIECVYNLSNIYSCLAKCDTYDLPYILL